MRYDNFVHLAADIWTNDKVLRVADILDEHEDFVALSFISLLTYARERQPDGDLSDLGVRALRRVLRWHGKCASTKVVAAMLEVGFLSDDPLRITNFMASHKKLLAAVRQANKRARERGERDVCVTDTLLESDGAVTHREKREESNPPTPLDELTIRARAMGEEWRPRPDDDAFFATLRKRFSPEHISQVMDRLAIEQAARSNGKRYVDLRLALGKWMKRETSEENQPHQHTWHELETWGYKVEGEDP